MSASPASKELVLKMLPRETATFIANACGWTRQEVIDYAQDNGYGIHNDRFAPYADLMQPPITPDNPAPKKSTVTPLKNVLTSPDITQAMDVLHRAEQRAPHSKKVEQLLNKALNVIDQLDDIITHETKVAELLAKRAELRKQLDEVNAELTGKPTKATEQVIASTATIRAWARDNGYDVPERGILPDRIINAYHDAHTPKAGNQ